MFNLIPRPEPISSHVLGGEGQNSDMDGIDDYTKMSGDAEVLDFQKIGQDNSFSVELQVYPTRLPDAGKKMILLSKSSDGKSDGYLLFIDDKGYPGFVIGYRGSNSNGHFTATLTRTLFSPLQMNQWNHLVMQFDDAQDRSLIGLNGVLNQSSFDSVFDGVINSPAALTVGGNRSYEKFFVGLIDEVRISSGIRYSGGNYLVPLAPFLDDAATRGLWHFDEGSCSRIMAFLDSSSSENALSGLNGAKSTQITSGWQTR
jgi:hypothetical protein